MSVLDDFDKIAANQTQDPAYQKRLEMARWLEKYPGDWEGISQWFVRRAIAYNNFRLLPIGEDKICYCVIHPFDLVRGDIAKKYGSEMDKHDWLNKNFVIAVCDSETKEVKTMFLTAKEYNEFVRLKHYGVYEFTR